MELTKLIRDASRVHETLQELEDGSLVTKKGCKIYIPSRFLQRNLAEIGAHTYIVGVFCISVDDTYYAVSMIDAMVELGTYGLSKVKIGEVEQLEFSFMPGSVVIKSTSPVCENTVCFNIYDEIICKGHVPWYLDYNDMAGLFDTARKHADTRVGDNRYVCELNVSIIARKSENRTIYYRCVPETLKEVRSNPPAFIGMKNVPYAATNTTTKITGSYFSVGVVSALVSPSDRTERIEGLLRK